jgi:hypothetical protein
VLVVEGLMAEDGAGYLLELSVAVSHVGSSFAGVLPMAYDYKRHCIGERASPRWELPTNKVTRLRKISI